ncbi:sensor histidine kinase [Lentzea sp. NPDC102401]|uniref:sensor histidine kinase n=1 Tax=Lentzea sp. NPDC102401 TaxID=3364128 RepID=UPI0038021776
MKRKRFSVKTRLSLLIGTLLLVSGALLLAANYLLVRGALLEDDAPAVAGSSSSTDEPQTHEDSANPQSVVRPMTIEQYRSDVLRTLLIQSGVALAGTGAIALLLGRLAAAGMLRPVHQVAATARKLSADNLDQRIHLPGPKDELTELADTFDEMLDRLARSFDSQRRFVANASHELRTPLATQRTMVEVALVKLGRDQATRELCEKLLVVNARSEDLIEGLLVLASTDGGLEHLEDVSLDRLVSQVLVTFGPALAQAGVRLRPDIARRTVRGDPVLLERLVTNLLDNAIKYNDGGTVDVRVGNGPAIEVANTGATVPADRTETLFEPFVRLDRDRSGPNRGVGLGLSIVASIAQAHHGSARAVPRDGGGLVVSVALP